MKILLVGATGAIGTSLVRQLLDDARQLRGGGHQIVGMLRSGDSTEALAKAGAGAVQADALDAQSVSDALLRVRPDVVINQLTSLPKHYTPEEMRAAGERDRRVRVTGHANLLAAAEAAGVRRYILQSAAFWYAPGPGNADENEPFAFGATPGIAAGTRTYETLERTLFENKNLQGVALRYGFFYGPGTWYSREGDMGEQVRQGKIPIIGEGQGISSFVHIDDAAAASVLALKCEPGIYNVVDDQPSEQRVWLPAFARYVDGPVPPTVTEPQAEAVAGADVVYYATRLRGASNAKAKRELGFRPRALEWL